MSRDSWPFNPTKDFHSFQPGSANGRKLYSVTVKAKCSRPRASSSCIFLTLSAMSVLRSLAICFMNTCLLSISFLRISKVPAWTVLIVDGVGVSVGSRRLDGVVFECGCNIRWIQLWMQRGEAGLHTQELYCKNEDSQIRLHNMYIQKCGKSRKTGRGRVCACVCVCELH